MAVRQLDQFLERLRAERRALEDQDWTPPEPPDERPTRDDYRLKPLDRTMLAPSAPPIPIDEVRNRLLVKLHEYLGSSRESVLLIKVPPGVGKTHVTTSVAQFFARRGQRGLWTAGRHSMFHDLELLPHFDPALWYHWRGLQGEIDAEPVCRHASGQAAWARKGYQAYDLCRQLCARDGWISRCPYRAQERRQEPLIFGQHQHLATGLSIKSFDFVVVDELPVSAFVEDRTVPVSGLDVGAIGPLGDLAVRLGEIAARCGKSERVAGRRLFDQIGELLDDVFAQVDVGAGSVPDVPQVWNERDVDRAPYWYVADLLGLASPEHRAWREGWPAWNERLWVTRAGLHLLRRSEPWEHLPRHIVVLDATAQPDLYQILFGRQTETYAPAVERQGRVYQVAGRLNGRDTTASGEALTAAGREMLEVVRRIAVRYERPGVVVWKALAAHFRRIFGDDRVLTYGALRGTNALQDVDGLILCGTPTPSGSQMLDLAVALSGEIRPFYRYGEDGRREPVYLFADREYRLSPEGVACLREQYGADTASATRRVGYYAHATLDAIHRQLREAELIQAIHRARINMRPADVWLLTSTPLQDEALDGLWNDPPIGPAGIHWQVWLRLEPWLRAAWEDGRSVTYETVADAAGVQETWARKSRWLDAIAAWAPDLWSTGRLEPVGRGNPRLGLIPLRDKPQYSLDSNSNTEA